MRPLCFSFVFLTLAGGWLACDDGAHEIADFIHLDDAKNPPVLSLIHIKAAGSDAPNRQVSVSKYEIVTAQAIKNLRHLDQLHLEDRLRAGLSHHVGNLVWRNRALTTRDRMLTTLGGLGHNHRRQVVILQPNLTKAEYDFARANPQTARGLRLRQLDTLLLAADGACRGLGAHLIVIGHR